MYDRPEMAAVTNRYWAAIHDAFRARGIAAPQSLTRAGNLFDHWRAPDLVLSQTCGLPYRTSLFGVVSRIGTPDFGLPGCPPGYYRSVILVRKDQPAPPPEDWPSLRLAYNEDVSQSGWGSAYNHATALGTTFGPRIGTGSHRGTVRALVEGRADIGFVDTHTWRLIRRWDAMATDLEEIGFSEPTPGLPYITAQHGDVPAMAEALQEVIGALSNEDRAALCIRSLVDIPDEAYRAVHNPPAP